MSLPRYITSGHSKIYEEVDDADMEVFRGLIMGQNNFWNDANWVLVHVFNRFRYLQDNVGVLKRYLEEYKAQMADEKACNCDNISAWEAGLKEIENCLKILDGNYSALGAKQ